MRGLERLSLHEGNKGMGCCCGLTHRLRGELIADFVVAFANDLLRACAWQQFSRRH